MRNYSLRLRRMRRFIRLSVISASGLRIIRHDHALLFLSVHHDFQRMGESDVAHMVGFLNGRQCIEDLTAVDALVTVGIDGEIAHTEGREVLEEVGTLTRVHTVVLQTLLDDEPRCRDVRPLHRNA